MTTKTARLICAALCTAIFAAPALAYDIPEATLDFRRAQTAISEGNYGKAIPILREFANGGNASSQWILGDLYKNGTGVVKDLELAAMWYQKALSEAPAKIPANPPEPETTEKDDWAVALLRLRKLRTMCPAITATLGAMHLQGQGLAKDPVEAYKWFELARSYGHPKAFFLKEFVAQSLDEDEIAEGEDRAEVWQKEHAKYDDLVLSDFSLN
ncbi:MAG: sel1 repeat family protein [Rhodospirillales bacterium]|jgi:uncharacterized protein|nr:sel1 repeat family protein [Rhodospirillales bacterium]